MSGILRSTLMTCQCLYVHQCVALPSFAVSRRPPTASVCTLDVWTCKELWAHCFDGMQMTQKILEAEGEGDPVQLDFFLKGNLALEKDPRRKPHSWLPDQVTCRDLLLPRPVSFGRIMVSPWLLSSCAAYTQCKTLPILVRLKA